MGVSLAGIGTYIGSFFAADGAAAAGAGAAGTATAGGAAAGTAATAAVGTGAAGGLASAAAGTAALDAVGVGAATADAGALASASAGIAAGSGAVGLGSIATTVSEAAALAQGASSLYSLANGPRGVSVPPSPQVAPDQSVANAEQQELARREAAGGLQSTTGTSGGQAGAVLNPGTVSNRSLLGG